MHIESLLSEVRELSDRFAVADVGAKPEVPVAWHSARGMLDIVMACGRISDISARISKAGYWECDPELLAKIGVQTRQILYHINEMRRVEVQNYPELG